MKLRKILDRMGGSPEAPLRSVTDGISLIPFCECKKETNSSSYLNFYEEMSCRMFVSQASMFTGRTNPYQTTKSSG